MLSSSLINKYISDLSFFKSRVGNGIFFLIISFFVLGLLEGIGLTSFAALLDANFLEGSGQMRDGMVVAQVLFFLGYEYNLPNILGFIFVIFLLKAIIFFSVESYNVHLQRNLYIEIKTELYSKISNLEYEPYLDIDTGSSSNIINEQVYKITEAFYYFVLAHSLLINAFVLSMVAVIMMWGPSLLILIFGGIVIYFFNKVVSKTAKISRQATSFEVEFSKDFIEFLKSYKYLHVRDLKKKMLKLGQFKIVKIAKLRAKANLYSAFINSAREPIVIMFVFSILLYEILVQDKSLSIVMVSLLILYRAINASLSIQGVIQTYARNIGSISIAQEFLEFLKQNQIIKGTGPLSGIKDSKFIELKHINFQYKNANYPALKDLNLTIDKGKLTTIIGPSGSGKTTVLSLICGLLKPTSGTVLINGQSLNNINWSAWATSLGFVPQEPVVYNSSFRSNVTMEFNSEDLSNFENDQKVLEVCKIVGLAPIIEKIPFGLDSQVSESGLKLSGGQRQRLALARELYTNPSVLFLDEATSAIDEKSEISLIKNVLNFFPTLTVIMISHRSALARISDAVYSIENLKAVRIK